MTASWEDRLVAAIGYEPVVVSIDGHPEITKTFRTVDDRDALVTRLVALLEEVSSEYWDRGYGSAVSALPNSQRSADRTSPIPRKEIDHA